MTNSNAADLSPASGLHLNAYRIAAIGVFFQYYFSRHQIFAVIYTVESHPFKDAFFPGFLQSKYPIILAYTLPIAFGIPLYVMASSKACRLHAVISLLSAAILLTHSSTFYDAVYVCQFWLSMWLVWFAFRSKDDSQALAAKAPFLFLCVVSLLFLGGTVGKLCEIYWQGEFSYVSFFETSDHPLILAIKDYLDVSSQLVLATWLSRGIIFVELLTACSLFAPPLLGVLWVIFVAGGMTISLGVGLVSLTGQVLSVALANLFLLLKSSKF